jgi:integrase
VPRPSKPWYRSDKDVWYARVAGRRVSLGVRGATNAASAFAAWHQVMAGVPNAKHKSKCVSTVADVISGFLADTATRVRPITHAFYRRFLEPFRALHGPVQISALTIGHAESFARRPTWSSSTRNDCLGTLATCFRWAERFRIVERSPLHGLRLPPKESQGAETVISEPAYRRLVAATSGDFRALIRFLWLTGCRPSEATNLTVERVDWKSASIVLRTHKCSHRGKRRVIFLSAQALAVVRAQRDRYSTGHLFRHRGGTAFGRAMLAQKFWRLSKRLGVRLTAYGFRHTFATDALSRGIPDTHVAELLGHSGTSMLHRNYSHLTARSNVLRRALDRVRR